MIKNRSYKLQFPGCLYEKEPLNQDQLIEQVGARAFKLQV